MSGVNIDPYTVEVDGVNWTASWDDKGNISYKGVDKNGKEVSSVAPSDVIKGAHAYGSSFGSKEGGKKEGQSSDDFKDTCDGLVIETNSDGTLKSANIAEANWTPRQREFVEKCLRAAAERGKNGNAKDGKEAKEGKTAKPERRSFTKALKKTFNKVLAEGKELSQGTLKDLSRLRKDVLLAGKLILGEGKLREVRDRAALRIHDNIEAMGLLSDNMQKRINDANKRIEERLGIENREKKPSYASQMIGKPNKDMKRRFGQLSGRTGARSVKISSNPNGRSNGREGGYGK